MNPNRLYTFRCPVCRNEFTYDEPGEPLCDGPGSTTGGHLPEVMRRIRVRDRNRTKEVSPEEGAARAMDTLLTPEALVSLGARIYGKLWMPKDKVNPWTGEEMDELGSKEASSNAEVHSKTSVRDDLDFGS